MRVPHSLNSFTFAACWVFAPVIGHQKAILADPPAASAAAANDEFPEIPKDIAEYCRSGNFEAALPFFEEAATKYPGSWRARKELGEILIALNRFDRAAQELRLAIRLAPKEISSHYDLAVALCCGGSFDAADAEFAESLRLSPKEPHWFYSQYANCCINMGRYEEGEKLLTTLLSMEPTADARLRRAVARNRLDQRAAAIEDCDVVLQDDPANQRALAYRAIANFYSGNNVAAEHDAKKAIAIEGDYAHVGYMMLGCVDLVRKDLKQADENLTKSIAHSDFNPHSLIFRAVSRMYQGDADACIRDLDGVIQHYSAADELNFELDGQGFQVYKLRGFAKLFQRYGVDGAIKDFTQSIQLTGCDETFCLRGWAYCLQAEWKLAKHDLEKAIQMTPEHPLGTLLLLHVLTACPDGDLRDGKRAVQLATRMCEKTKWKYPEYIQMLAKAYSEFGDFENGVKFQSRVVSSVQQKNQSDGFLIVLWNNFMIRSSLSVSEQTAIGLMNSFQQHKAYHELPNSAELRIDTDMGMRQLKQARLGAEEKSRK